MGQKNTELYFKKKLKVRNNFAMTTVLLCAFIRLLIHLTDIY